MSLKEELMEIRGIGDAKADEIMTVLDGHGSSENVEKALEYMEQEQYGYAEKFLRREV